jgi:hypothetical protein
VAVRREDGDRRQAEEEDGDMSATGRGERLGGDDDFYETPAYCVHRLLEKYSPPGGIWLEPGAGSGAIIKAVRQVRTDMSWVAIEKQARFRKQLELLTVDTIIGDYLTTWVNLDVVLVLGNPPFSLAMEFIQHSMAAYPNADVALLLRLPFLASNKRATFMQAFAPDAYVLPDRPCFAKGDSDNTDYAWMVWPKLDPEDTDHVPEIGHLQVLASTPEELR